MTTLSTIATQLGIDTPMPACVIDGVCTDTRDFQPGALFVAIVGPRFDGHDFVEEAVALGAAAVLVSRPIPEVSVPVLQVADTQVALAKWAKATRLASPAQVVALTGSCGKTSTKTMLATILSPLAPTVATLGNYNNEWGVPLTVLRLAPSDQFLVCEMGARRPGDIAYLTDLVAPDVALITNAGPAHLAGMGDVAGVARTKGEIFQGLRPQGTAIINADDAYVDFWIDQLNEGQSFLLFGQGERAAVCARGLTWDASHAASFLLCLPTGETHPVVLQWVGAHSINNALAAAAAAYALGVPGAHIAAGLSASVPPAQRLLPVATPSGAVVIDDTYNANPASTRAAIAALAQHGGKTILVLGDMLDLGDQAVPAHAEIGRYVSECGISALYTCGDFAAHTAQACGDNARHFAKQADLLAVLSDVLAPGVTVLVKGSRAMGMEHIVSALLEEKR